METCNFGTLIVSFGLSATCVTTPVDWYHQLSAQNCLFSPLLGDTSVQYCVVANNISSSSTVRSIHLRTFSIAQRS